MQRAASGSGRVLSYARQCGSVQSTATNSASMAVRDEWRGEFGFGKRTIRWDQLVIGRTAAIRSFSSTSSRLSSKSSSSSSAGSESSSGSPIEKSRMPFRQSATPAQLLETNQKWITDTDPELFTSLAKGQSPSIFWLGCCDSRVPAELVTGAAPGDLFVHRNIANTFSPKDGSALAALAYAVNVLNVTHVVVCGHQGCGGVQAALASAKDRRADKSEPDEGTEAIQQWLGPIRALAVANLRTSDISAPEKDPVKELSHLVEQNVCAQVSNVANSSVLQKAWRDGKDVTVHGWVYDIASGKITDLKVSEGSEVSQ